MSLIDGIVAQAWYKAAANGMGGWASLHNPMPNWSGQILYIQIHSNRSKGYPLVACPFFMATCISLWGFHHLPSDAISV